nr:hypothetical protein [Propionibacterium sp.]
MVRVCRDIEQHVGALGWDQPARLFALVPTLELLAAEPSLAAALAEPADRSADALSAVEQDEFHAGGDLIEDLARIAWPETVRGCALSVERVFVPPEVEPHIPDEPDAAADFVAAHPRRQDVRVVVAVTRSGAAHGVARLKSAPDALLSGADLVPGLARALARTLES